MSARLPLPALAAAASLATAGLFLPGSLARAADIYRCDGRDGVAHFSNAPTSDCFRPIIKVVEARPEPAPAAGGTRAAVRLPGRAALARYERAIAEAARRHQLEAALIKAVIRAESNFDPRAVSRRGARGLMQLMPTTVARYQVADPFEPVANIEAGTRHLKSLLQVYDGDLVLALAAYNAGEQAVLRYGRRVPPFAETQDYVASVRRHFDAYRGAPTLTAHR